MVAWATPEDVFNLTGLVADEGAIAIAQSIVDLHADVESDAIQVSLLWPKDLSRLRKATAYQTKFMSAQIDVLDRQDVKSVSQDDLGAVYNTPNGQHLAPLARLAISKLRWKRARPLRSRRRRQGVLTLEQTWVRDAEYDGGAAGVWRPL